MYNLFISLSLIIKLLVSSTNSSFYQFSVASQEGPVISTNAFQGQKVVIVTLPVTVSSGGETWLKALASLATSYKGKVIFLGVPTYEEGFSEATKFQLTNWYRELLGESVMVTEGLYAHKNATSQHPLFAWLTHAEQNGHFDGDVMGVGQLFFISAQGELNGVFEPSEQLYTQSIQKKLNR